MAERTYKKITNAYIDDEGNVCYKYENMTFSGEIVILPEYFNFVPSTPHMGRLEIYHIAFPEVLLVSFNMEHDYDEFMEDMAERVAFYIENYC